jgi:hypothetical protein
MALCLGGEIVIIRKFPTNSSPGNPAKVKKIVVYEKSVCLEA